MEILNKADELKARLASAMAAKGVPPPQGATPTELGWGPIGLPHPMAWTVPKGASNRDLEKLSRQVGCLLGFGRFPRDTCAVCLRQRAFAYAFP